MATIFRSITYILFFLMLVFPMVLELLFVKVLLFGSLLIIYSLMLAKRKTLPICPIILQWAVLIAFIGIFFFILGLIYNTPGVYKESHVYIIWPLVYVFLLSSIVDQKLEDGLKLIIIISTIFLSLYGLSQILVNLSVLPEYFTFKPFKSEEVGFGEYKGFVETTIHGINSMSFLVPFCMVSAIHRLESEKKPFYSFISWLAVITSLTFSIFTARRALWLVILITPVFILFFRYISHPRFSKKIALEPKKAFILFIFTGIAIVCLLYFFSNVYSFDIQALVNNFKSAFSMKSENRERIDQFFGLIEGIKEYPIFGSGFGASAEKYGTIRSIKLPWSYELYYLSLLYKVGIIGFSIYSIGVFWIYRQGIRMMSISKTSRRRLMPFMVGMSCMFVAGGTNPVFIRFDGIWFFFLPLAIINVWMLNKETSTA